MNKIDFEIFKSTQQEKKLTEIYLGSIPISWEYAVVDYEADCTEAIPFTPFDKIICGLLSIDEVLSFEEIASILGLNVTDKPESNQYKDIAEYEILIEALNSLTEFEMIEKDDSRFSSCRLTEIGKEYVSKGTKFKTIENKSFTLYFDTTTNEHEQAKTVFQDLKGNAVNTGCNIDFKNENLLKSFAERQIPDIYDTTKGNSFANTFLNRIKYYMVELYAGVIYDFQLNTFRIKVYSHQTKSNYFSEKINSREQLRNDIIKSFVDSIESDNSLKSEKQALFEEKTCKTQSDAEYLIYQNKPQEALNKIDQFYKQAEFIEKQSFIYNINNILDADSSEIWLSIPNINDTFLKLIVSYANSKPNTRIYVQYTAPIPDFIFQNTNNILWLQKDKIEFFCLVISADVKFSIREYPYCFPYNDKLHKITVLTREKFDDTTDKFATFRRKYAEFILPELFTDIEDELNKELVPDKENITILELSDSNLLIVKWLQNNEYEEKYKDLLCLKQEKLQQLKSQHKVLIVEKIDILKKEVDIEKIEKIDQITKIKNQLENIEKECFPDYSDILKQLGTFEKALIEQETYIKDQLLAKHYIIDTNVFVDYPEILSKIDAKHNIILSAKVIDELDKLKRKLKGDKRENAEKALKLINHKLNKKNKNIKTARADLKLLPADFNDKSSDNLILCVALMYKDNNPCLITSDNGLQAKAKVCDIPALSLVGFLDKNDLLNNLDKNVVKKEIRQQEKLQYIRLNETITFKCVRCNKEKTSKKYVRFGDDDSRKLCNGCYGAVLANNRKTE
ncbi:hypothetical protein EZS27_011087 [termite gut metagenome]|uniref:PIN domain-containing protein n=1 Tax=termite gut metagenome TaxID=433724 RepID=A0A5J4S5I4_9ZZZZ